MTPSKIKKLADQHEVDFSVDSTARCWSVECWSPDGKVWKATGTHFYALPGDGYYTKPDWNETHVALKEAIEFGFDECQDKDCDVCHA